MYKGFKVVFGHAYDGINIFFSQLGLPQRTLELSNSLCYDQGFSGSHNAHWHYNYLEMDFLGAWVLVVIGTLMPCTSHTHYLIAYIAQ